MKSINWIFALCAAICFAACTPKQAPDTAADAVINAYETASLLPAGGAVDAETLTLDDAYRLQSALNAHLGQTAPPIGYKVAFGSPGAQASVGLGAPVIGRLYPSMFLADGSEISTASGAALLYEADFLVRVSDAAINDAASIEDVIASLDLAYPFIEVPDGIRIDGQPLDGKVLTAFNAGARWGVKGDAIPLSPIPDFQSRLAMMTVTMQDMDGQVIAERTGNPDGPHPLSSILFLRDTLHSRGERLKVGDIISPGTFIPPVPAKSGEAYTVTYTGLTDAPVSISVKFVP